MGAGACQFRRGLHGGHGRCQGHRCGRSAVGKQVERGGGEPWPVGLELVTLQGRPCLSAARQPNCDALGAEAEGWRARVAS